MWALIEDFRFSRAESNPGFLFAEKGVPDEEASHFWGQNTESRYLSFPSVCPECHYLTSRNKAPTTKLLLRMHRSFVEDYIIEVMKHKLEMVSVA